MDDRTWGRRRLLQTLGGMAGGLAFRGTVAGGVASLLARPASAEAPSAAHDRYYILCYFNGAWDMLLGLDPRDPAVFSRDRVDETRIETGYEDLPLGGNDPLVRAGAFTFGPYIGGLARHASRLAVVRGIDMQTVAHETGRRRFLTGRPPTGINARGSSAATWLAAETSDGEPIPSLAINSEAYNVDHGAAFSALKVSNVNDLLRVARAGGTALDPRVQRTIDAHLDAEEACPPMQESAFVRSAIVGRATARRLVRLGLADRFDFTRQTPEMEALRGLYGFSADRTGIGSTMAAGALAARAIMLGVSRCVSLTVTGGLDTHGSEWAAVAGPRQQVGWDVIAHMADDLAATEYKETGSSWLDHTTIVAFSEFTRTPMRNAAGGRDHHIVGASALLGGNVRGNTIVGASSDLGMEAQPVDLQTGRVDPGGSLIHPEHIWQTLFRDAGFNADDVADLRAPTIPALLRG